jgi:hypothetical protein
MIYALLHLVPIVSPIEYQFKIAVPSLYDLVVHCNFTYVVFHYSMMVDPLRRMAEIFYHVTLCNMG